MKRYQRDATTKLSMTTDGFFNANDTDNERLKAFKKVLKCLNEPEWVADVLFDFSKSEQIEASQNLIDFYTEKFEEFKLYNQSDDEIVANNFPESCIFVAYKRSKTSKWKFCAVRKESFFNRPCIEHHSFKIKRTKDFKLRNDENDIFCRVKYFCPELKENVWLDCSKYVNNGNIEKLYRGRVPLDAVEVIVDAKQFPTDDDDLFDLETIKNYL